MPWYRRLPVLRTYAALRAAQMQLAETKADLRAARAERDGARQMLKRTHGHVLSHGKLKDVVFAHAERYKTAEPYPHVVVDDVFEPALLQEILKEIDAMDRTQWHTTQRETERKSSSEDFRHFGPLTRTLISQLNGAPFLAFLEMLTGIEGLVPDPHLRGGGLHEIHRDGVLGVHADFNYYPRLGLYRRLNLLLYLNADWSREWGGELELWDKGGTHCVTSVSPVFNRMVIFDTSDRHYHGHPRPLQSPPDRARKSIALYYYTVRAPAGCASDPHTTIFIQPGVPAAVEMA
jgi:hypothetical protein